MSKKEHRFIIQNNLIAENDLKRIQTACQLNGIEFEEVQIIPFTDELPEFTVDGKQNIYYGSTTFINNVYKKYGAEGVFFDPNEFLISNYFKKWGEHMLNYGADIMTIPEFITKAENVYKFKDDHMIFIRPNADDKAFDGQVMSLEEIKGWKDTLIQYDNIKSLLETDIVFSEPFNISKEWRNFIVNGEIISSSLYRQNFKLRKSAFDIPIDMLYFVSDRLKEYQPAKAFVIDVALCGDAYFIIECGCINSTGFYKANIEKIVMALNQV